jgi:hypothetical protein
MDKLFIVACQNGKLNEAKEIYFKAINEGHKIDIRAEDEYAFRYSCYNGHIKVAKWLCQISKKSSSTPTNVGIVKQNDQFCLPTSKTSENLSVNEGHKIDIHTQNEYAFRSSCSDGHIKVAKWLWNLSVNEGHKIDIHAQEEDAFRHSCYSGRIEVAKWLWNLSVSEGHKIDIHAQNEYAFRDSCYEGYIEIAKWLWNLSVNEGHKIDIHTNNENAFRRSCNNGHIEVAKWLASLCEDYNLIIENGKIISYKIIGTYDKILELYEKTNYDQIISKFIY